MIAQARCDNAKSSVPLGFSTARAGNLWGLRGLSTALLRSCFFGGGVIGVFPVAACAPLTLSLRPARTEHDGLFLWRHIAV